MSGAATFPVKTIDLASGGIHMHSEVAAEGWLAQPRETHYSTRHVPLQLSVGLLEALSALMPQQETGLLVTLASGWAVLLGRWYRQDGLVIAASVGVRSQDGHTPDAVSVPIVLSSEGTAEQLLRDVQAVVAQVRAGREPPVGKRAGWDDRVGGGRHTVYLSIEETPVTILVSCQTGSTESASSEGATANAEANWFISLSEREGHLTGRVRYSQSGFDQDSVEHMVSSWKALLESMVAGAQQSIGRLAMLTAVDRRRLLYGFNDTLAVYPKDRLIHELFEEQVRNGPDAAALLFLDQSLTYAELNAEANQLAHFLIQQGVTLGDYVPILMPRSVQLVIAQLAVLKSGGAYVPIDPQLPEERQTFIVRDCSARLVLARRWPRPGLVPQSVQWIVYDDLVGSLRTLPAHDVDLRSRSSFPAYVMYTSGSTGAPKGVAIPHRGVVRLVINNRYAQIEATDCVAHCSNPAFDASTFEIWAPLLNGAQMSIVPASVVLQSERFADVLKRQGVNVLFQTTALFNQHSRASTKIYAGLRYLMFGGEAADPNTVRVVLGEQPPGCLVNLYGPTESTMLATFHRIGSVPDQATGLPIGKPVSNTHVYILDEYLQPVPIEVAGEIYVGGPGVAIGYLNRPELTSQRFIADPFGGERQARIYRTGDLGRWCADGSIEFMGRDDEQVKIRGFRIELGEIEGQLSRHPHVREAVVVARESAPGDRSLVAYITKHGEVEPKVEELRAHLSALLPGYMVPSAFVVLDRLPLTSNGKLDRKALPAPNLSAYARREYEAPLGESELILAEIWQELLGVEPVGRHDGFFELGGHSLLVVQLMEKLRREGMRLEVRAIYEAPTLAAVAHALIRDVGGSFDVPPSRIPEGCTTITPQMVPLVELEPEHIQRIAQLVPGGAANIQDIYPLTPLQEGMLFHHLLDADRGDAYVVPTVLAVSSHERLQELVAALQRVIGRHDILRTAVFWEQLPQPVQVVVRRVTLPVAEVGLDPARHPQEQIKEWVQPERQRISLWQAPLMRLQVAADRDSERWYALLQIHHIVDDAVSLKILISEVVSCLEGRAELLPNPIQYKEHVAQSLARSRSHDAEEFFRRKLADVDASTAPFGLVNVHGDGSGIDEASEQVDSTLARSVRSVARRSDVSVATLFHAAWSLVVAVTSCRDDVVFGSVLLGRLQGSAGAQRIVGMFVNTLPLRIRLGNVTALELVRQTRLELAELLSHEDASLVMAKRCSGIEGAAPLFSAVLNYRHSIADPESEWASARGIQVCAFQYRTNYPISLSVDDLGDGFGLVAQTDRRVEARRLIGYMRSAMQSLVDALERAPHTPALALSILPESERELVTKGFNRTDAPYPDVKAIHELFEEQVERTSETIALVYQDRSLTYADLNGRANQLARYLIEHGVEPDQLVGICVERSLEMVIGILGILKAGGAYLPLDPDYPAERLAAIVADAEPRLLLTQSHLRERLPETSAYVIALDDEWREATKRSACNLDRGAASVLSRHLAYVIYTSGSTGRPKGVMIEHKSVASLWQGLEQIYRRVDGCQRVAVNASFNFDASVKQFVQLISGRTVVLVPQEVRWDAALLFDYIDQQHIEAIDCTPSQLKTWVSAGLLQGNRRPLRLVLVGGEAIDADLWNELAQSASIEFCNVYGPTESTVDTTFSFLRGDRSAPHIGRVMENRRVYILDSIGRPLPIGVAGEICIGGAGVARGYLNRPELTAGRFIADSFNGDSRSRVYRTGDLGRWRADGTIEYVGRNDQQVKIRGFRIELGEIEAQLIQHPDVESAVVLARSDDGAEKRLVAYVVAEASKIKGLQRADSGEATAEMVTQWKQVHDETYSVGVPGPSFIGWNSSFTGQPIPESQMQEWLTNTIGRIQALKPSRILEIGCGVGLLLQHLASSAAAYVGIDFSAFAIQQLKQWMHGQECFQHVEVIQRNAMELQDLSGGSFDLVVINSVVQYFPDIGYLVTVLHEALRLLTPDGKVFIGDVRDLSLLTTFHSAVQLGKAAATVNVGQLRKRIARAVDQDKELVIDPEFFRGLPGRMPGIAAVDVQLKRGSWNNELTSYRYDVVLHAGQAITLRLDYRSLRWGAEIGSAAKLEATLKEHRWPAVRLRSIPNARVARDLASQVLIETSEEEIEASALRRYLNERDFVEDPEQFWELAKAQDYDIVVSPAGGGSFEVELVDRAHSAQGVLTELPEIDTKKSWHSYANQPLDNSFRQQLIPKLRDYLKRRLPEYMIPSGWLVLKQLPLTPSGKIDYRGLPATQGRGEEMGEYLAPRTELECMLAELWAQVLQVDQVGLKDDFFEIGGHSLLAMQVIVRIRSSLSIDIPMSVMFEFPTVEQLSAQVDRLRHARLLDDIVRGDVDTKEILARVADMPESEVQELMRKLHAGGRT